MTRPRCTARPSSQPTPCCANRLFRPVGFQVLPFGFWGSHPFVFFWRGRGAAQHSPSNTRRISTFAQFSHGTYLRMSAYSARAGAPQRVSCGLPRVERGRLSSQSPKIALVAPPTLGTCRRERDMETVLAPSSHQAVGIAGPRQRSPAHAPLPPTALITRCSPSFSE